MSPLLKVGAPLIELIYILMFVDKYILKSRIIASNIC